MLTLPSYVTSQSIEKVIGLYMSAIQKDENSININASGLKFIDPLGICLLSCMCRNIQDNGKSAIFHNLPDNQKSYLSRMDVFKQCNAVDESDLPRYDRTGVLAEVRSISRSRDVDENARKIARSLVGELPEFSEDAKPDEMTGQMPYDQILENLNYILNELMENATTHGKKSRPHAQVWAASQYYRRSATVKLGIVDNGCGLYHSLHDHHSDKVNSDKSAIEAALQPRVSCNRELGLSDDSVNQGIGLTVASEMVKQSAGKILILSGNAIYRFADGKETFDEMTDLNWQGVIVNIEINRENLKTILHRQVIDKMRTEHSIDSEIDIDFI